MSKRYGILAAVLAASLAISGCSGRKTESSPEFPAQSAASSGPAQENSEKKEKQKSDPFEAQAGRNAGPSYIEQVAQETVAKFTEPQMSEYDKAKAAFDYMIEATSLTEPIGLDLWRIRGDNDELPSFVENRSLSVLLYGIGMCEDYAAAFTMLLRGMDIEAEYVPGLTYSANGTGLVDHAWTIAKIDGVWYHLDPQLEDNISRRDTTRYKYFMRGDATMAGSHRWGQNLINSGLLAAEQNEEIARDFLFEACPQDYPTPAPRTFTSAPTPDIEALQAEIKAEFLEYERANGPLKPLELNLIPPVFGLEGFGPPE